MRAYIIGSVWARVQIENYGNHQTLLTVNILFLASRLPGYSEWFLYAGLYRIFGNKVVDYPRLDTLWEPPQDTMVENYPVQGWLSAESGSTAIDRSRLSERLQAGDFDLVIISSRAWDEVIDFIPLHQRICFLDGEDSNHIFQQLLERQNLLLYAKRETPQDFSHPKLIPLPFAFETDRFPVATEKTNDVFGIFNPVSHPDRKRFLDAIPHLTSSTCRLAEQGERWVQDEYKKSLCASRIGLSIRGTGFDTVRFWEILAAGVPLFSQRPVIQIPHLPVEGEGAIYFDTPEEMATKLDYYLQHEEELQNIAEKGHRNFQEFHTCQKRAEYFIENCLARIEP